MDAENPDADAQATKQPEFLTEAKLFDALFELADIWCPSIDEYEYQEFFKQLAFRLKYAGKDDTAYDIMP